MYFVIGVSLVSGFCYWAVFTLLLRIHESEWIDQDHRTW
jgi:hypothetical protein